MAQKADVLEANFALGQSREETEQSLRKLDVPFTRSDFDSHKDKSTGDNANNRYTPKAIGTCGLSAKLWWPLDRAYLWHGFNLPEIVSFYFDDNGKLTQVWVFDHAESPDHVRDLISRRVSDERVSRDDVFVPDYLALDDAAIRVIPPPQSVTLNSRTNDPESPTVSNK